MSHKDAPPETESQKACREWWEKARPTVKRAWGRAQDGSFLAEETRLIHKAWEAASQQSNAEIERLRELCGMAYQLAGVHDAPEKWLDALSNAASGRPFSTDGLLPYMPQAVCNAEIRALELEREIEALRAEVERLNAELVRLEKIAGYGGLASDAPERMILASEVYDGMQSCDKWCEVRRVIDDGQPMPESATPYVRADRAERLAEALEDIRSRSSINLAMHPNPFALTARLGDIYQIADAALEEMRS